MNKEQKKKYIKPETTILEMDYEGSLLSDSCTFEGEGGACSDWNDSEDPNDSGSSGDQFVMKKKYCTPEVNVFYVDTAVDLLQQSLPAGPTGMIPDTHDTSLPKDVGQ